MVAKRKSFTAKIDEALLVRAKSTAILRRMRLTDFVELGLRLAIAQKAEGK